MSKHSEKATIEDCLNTIREYQKHIDSGSYHIACESEDWTYKEALRKAATMAARRLAIIHSVVQIKK